MRPLTIAKRGPTRRRVFLAAELDSGTGTVPVRIRDVSRSGALLESDEPPKAGSTVRMTCGNTTVAARVAWVDKTWFGLEFFTPVVGGALLDATGARLKVSAPRTYRAGDIPD